MRVGIIGCGNISQTYFECQNLFNNFSVVACADINIEAAEKSAEKYKVKAFSVFTIISLCADGIVRFMIKSTSTLDKISSTLKA